MPIYRISASDQPGEFRTDRKNATRKSNHQQAKNRHYAIQLLAH